MERGHVSRWAVVGGLASCLLLTGCLSDSSSESDASASSASAAQDSANAAHDDDFEVTVTYHEESGTREVDFTRYRGGYPWYGTILEYCIDTNTIEVQVSGEGGGAHPLPAGNACADMKITRDDNLPIPGQPPR